MKQQSVWLLALAAVLVVGCASQKGPAEQAVAGTESALAAVRHDAQRYVPDQLQRSTRSSRPSGAVSPRETTRPC